MRLISIVSPAYNEAGNIPLVTKEVERVMRSISRNYDYEYIIVDDGSQDKTWEAIIKQSQKNKKIKGLRLTRNFGQQLALTAGIDTAKGDAVIYCDSDLQHPPSLFPQMIRCWEDGAKVIHTLRIKTENEPFHKKIMSKLFYALANFLSDIPIKSGMADFKLLDQEVCTKLRAMRERNRFLRGMVPWLGYPSTTIKYQAGRRAAGAPRYNFRRNLTFAKSGILSLSTKPLKYVGYLGLILMVLSFLGLTGSGALMVIKNDFRYISPTVLLILFNTFLIGIVLTCLGIVALYVSYLHQEVIQRPLYLISERTNAD